MGRGRAGWRGGIDRGWGWRVVDGGWGWRWQRVCIVEWVFGGGLCVLHSCEIDATALEEKRTKQKVSYRLRQWHPSQSPHFSGARLMSMHTFLGTSLHSPFFSEMDILRANPVLSNQEVKVKS